VGTVAVMNAELLDPDDSEKITVVLWDVGWDAMRTSLEWTMQRDISITYCTISKVA
jgi:hypothetical protein